MIVLIFEGSLSINIENAFTTTVERPATVERGLKRIMFKTDTLQS